MCARDNLLDLIRSFTIFSTNDKGQTVKVVGRYQQFRAVKLAVKRLLEGRNRRERSGIIWHTQRRWRSSTKAAPTTPRHRTSPGWTDALRTSSATTP